MITTDLEPLAVPIDDLHQLETNPRRGDVEAVARSLSLQFGAAILNAGWQLRQSIVWVKDGFALGHSDYHYSHEPIWFSYTPGHEPVYLAYTPGGKGRRGRGGDEWFGDNAQSSVLTYPKPKRSELHPTMKPVALIEHCLQDFPIAEKTDGQ